MPLDKVVVHLSHGVLGCRLALELDAVNAVLGHDLAPVSLTSTGFNQIAPSCSPIGAHSSPIADYDPGCQRAEHHGLGGGRR